MTRTHQLFALAGPLIVIAVPALLNPYRFIGLGDRYWLWLLLLITGFVLLTAAVVRQAIARRGLPRMLLAGFAGCLALAALLGLGMAYLATLVTDHTNEQRVAAVSPDGRFTVILTYRPGGRSDAAEGLYLQTTDGFFSRREHLGCAAADSVRFAGPNAIVVSEAGEESTVRFDPAEVRLVGWPLGDSCPIERLYTG